MADLRSLARRAMEGSDRPGGRAVLGRVASARYSRAAGEPVRIRFQERSWLHHYPTGVVAADKIGAPSPRLWDEETRSTFLVVYQPHPGDVIVDVGAGIGTELLTFARGVGPRGRVIAIEAHPGTYARLRQHARLNHLDNVEAVNAAITDTTGHTSIGGADGDRLNSLLLSSPSAAAHTVAAFRLDDLLADRHVAGVDFLKMNIEGAERMAIRGMARTVGQTKAVCICCHDFLADRGGPEAMRTKDLVMAFLADHGFTVTLVEEDPARPWARDHVHAVRRA